MGFSCPNCSADNEGTARFCRKCGARLYPEDLHEASTRNLEPGAAQPATSDTPARSTGRIDRTETAPPPAGFGVAPNYVPPPVGSMAGPYPGGYPEPRKQRNWAVILLAAFASLVLLCGVGGLVLVSTIRSTVQEKGVSFDDKGIQVKDPDSGSTFMVGEVDPSKLSETASEWYYPDSTISMYNEQSGGELNLIMTSHDDPDSIAAHYKSVLGDVVTTTDHTDGEDRTVSLSAEERNVTIVSDPMGEGTQIIVSLGDKSGPRHGIPGGVPGGIPTPPPPPSPGKVPGPTVPGVPPPPPPAPPAKAPDAPR
jgi:hypothetical protein